MKAWIAQLDRILRGEVTKPEALREGLRVPVPGLAVVLVLLAAVHGACVGTFSMVRTGGAAWPQLFASVVKVPMLFFLTLVVTFPSLYVFNALMGSRLTIGSAFRLLIVALATLIATLASLGPIVAFFAVSTTSYSFMVVLNVTACAVAGILGLSFLLRTLHRMVLVQEELELPPLSPPVVPPAGAAGPPPEAPAGNPPGLPPPLPLPTAPWAGPYLRRRVKGVFYVWCLVFALVGAQMGWVLRPFIGDPNKPFTFFRERQGNFFEAVGRALSSLLSG